MVITSPPYNMNLRVRDGEYCSRQIVPEISTKYKSYSDNMPMNEYYTFNCSVVSECLRVSNLVAYNIQLLTGNRPELLQLLGDFAQYVKDVVIWDKINAQPAIQTGVLNSQFEMVVLFQRDGAIPRQFNVANWERGKLSNLWRIPRAERKHKNHGAAFPQTLVSVLLSNFTNVGDLICDPFVGTGTTPYVCARLSRSFVGFEIDADYCEYARRRVAGATEEIDYNV